MQTYKFIEYPFDTQTVRDGFQEKVKDRHMHMILCVTPGEILEAELVKLLLVNGFDGVLVSGMETFDDERYIKRVNGYLQALPTPYNDVCWDIIAGINQEWLIKSLNKVVTGVVFNKKYIRVQDTGLLNNLDYHSSELYKLRSFPSSDIDDIIDCYVY